MYREGSSQGNRAYIKTFLPADCWRYFSLFFRSHDTFSFLYVQKRVCTRKSTYNLSQQKVRLATVLEICEALTAASINQLCQLFGNSFGVGVRKKFPKLNQPSINMGTGDTVNIVSPTPLTNDKISFRYDSGASKLNITVRYTNSPYGSEFHLKYGNNPQMEYMISPASSDEENAERGIVYAQLMVSNRLHRVTHVTTYSVRVVPEDGSMTSLYLPLEHANDLADEYNL